MFGVSTKAELEQITEVLTTMWTMTTYFCYPNFTNTSMAGFNVPRIVKEVKSGIASAEHDLDRHRRETSLLLQLKTPISTLVPVVLFPWLLAPLAFLALEKHLAPILVALPVTLAVAKPRITPMQSPVSLR